MNANIGVPFHSDFIPDPQLDWQMSRSEKYCLINLLSTLRPEVSVEIGTYQGGSLQVISKYSAQTYSIDISPSPKKLLEEKFPSVIFKVAEGHKILHNIFEEIDHAGKKLGFVLIDGDHTRLGVSRDIEAVLSYPHKHPFTIILHDSFNPQCRKGMRNINYAQYPSVEYVELDYIPGAFWHNGTYREMWGGFGMIRVNPGMAHTPVVVYESQGHLFRLTKYFSLHVIKDPLQFLDPLKNYIFKKLGRKSRSSIYHNFE